MIQTILYNLPPHVSGFTVKKGDNYTVFLNARQSWVQQKATYDHEMEHIQNEDFDSDMTADELEGMLYVDN